jgi:hypothetical protein
MFLFGVPDTSYYSILFVVFFDLSSYIQPDNSLSGERICENCSFTSLFLWLVVLQEYILKIFSKWLCVSSIEWDAPEVSNCGEPESSQLFLTTAGVGQCEVATSATDL